MSIGKGTRENQQAIWLLEAAIRHLEKGEPAGAAWRVADAGDWIARSIKAKGNKFAIGVHGPTGLGNQIINIPSPFNENDAEEMTAEEEAALDEAALDFVGQSLEADEG